MKWLMTILAAGNVGLTAYFAVQDPLQITWQWPVIDAVVVSIASYIWGAEI